MPSTPYIYTVRRSGAMIIYRGDDRTIAGDDRDDRGLGAGSDVAGEVRRRGSTAGPPRPHVLGLDRQGDYVCDGPLCRRVREHGARLPLGSDGAGQLGLELGDPIHGGLLDRPARPPPGVVGAVLRPLEQRGAGGLQLSDTPAEGVGLCRLLGQVRRERLARHAAVRVGHGFRAVDVPRQLVALLLGGSAAGARSGRARPQRRHLGAVDRVGVVANRLASVARSSAASIAWACSAAGSS